MPGHGWKRNFFPAALAICVMLAAAGTSRAAWLDGAWSLRRPVTVTWDAEHSDGQDLGSIEFFATGGVLPGGSGVRVTTEDNQIIPSDVLMVGPGDRVRVAFALQKNVKKYYVYWGNPNPPANKLKLEYHRGLMMEMRIFPGGQARRERQMIETWDRAKDVIGRTFVDRPFIGVNLLGDQQQTISKLTGPIFAPIDGDYQFAMAADDLGALLIDDKPLVFAHGAPADTRFNGTIHLTRGAHALVIYHVDLGGEWVLSVGWKRPDMQKIELINREAFGYTFAGQPGQLEDQHKTLVADFTIDYDGEAWYFDRISHHYTFAAYPSKVQGVKYEWDFGDGQVAAGAKVDHVFLSQGVYPVKLTLRFGGNSDARVIRLIVERQHDRIDHPRIDTLADQSKIVAKYDLNALPPADLVRAVFLHEKGENWDAMTAAAMQVAAIKQQGDPESAYAALYEAADALRSRKGPAAVEKLWAAAPRSSNLQPRALRQQARELIWGLADFAKAASVLKDAKTNDPQSRRLLGMALVLNGSVTDGEKVLRELPEQGDPDKRAAISGAMARTVEFYLDQKDADSGDEQWDRWMSKYPGDFLEGYSAVLKAKLIALRGDGASAAKMAEAFAAAVPKSSYAPQLLDQASKLLAKSDARHSQELRVMLKQRYPEDPLSQ